MKKVFSMIVVLSMVFGLFSVTALAEAPAAVPEGESIEMPAEGESPGGESPEGESPEGESPEGESPADMMPPGGIIKDAPPDVEALIPVKGNINKEIDMKPSGYASLNTFNRDDTGYIYIGYDIVDGKLTEESNWTTDDVENITLTPEVTGAAFTAVRLSGEESVTNVTGNILLTDAQSDNDGTHASDFSGVGSALSAVNGSILNCTDLNVVTYGFVRAALILDNYCKSWVKNCQFLTFGNNPFVKAWDGYYNSANTGMMLSPPWVLGIQGGVRTVNVLDSQCTLVIEDSRLASGGWGVVSTDGCSKPVIYIADSELEIMPAANYGMDSGWELFGYDPNAYGSGYGAYIIGNTEEHVYGSNIHGGTYAAIAREGKVDYQSSTGNIAVVSATGEDMGIIEGDGQATVIDTVFGWMTHSAEDAWVTVSDRTIVNTQEATFLYRDTGHAYFTVDGAELNPENGIILQMMDTDDSTVGGFNPFNEFLYEDAGLPSANGNETGETENNENVIMTLTNGKYEGDFLNGTGYYTQAGDVLDLTIGEGAALTGSVALTETFHGMEYRPEAVEVLKGYGDDVAYVLMDQDFQITENEADAAYIQFTQFSVRQYFMLCHVLNRLYNNGYSAINVVVSDGGEWTVADESLITYLKIDGGKVFGTLIENEDGSLTLLPSEDEIPADEYGIFTEANVAEAFGMGPAGGSPGGESAEGESPAGESPEGESPEGESPAEEATAEEAIVEEVPETPAVEDVPTTGPDQVVNGVRLGDLDFNQYTFDELVAMGFDMTPPEN